jgi:hypothetical protein
MAISAPTRSNQYVFYANGAPVSLSAPHYELSALLTFTAAGFTSAAAGDLSLLRLPAGRWRILLDRSKVVCPQGTATSDLDLGIAAYTKPDGTTQSAQNNVLADSLDVGGAALNQLLGAGSVIVDSRDGADVVGSFDTANSPSSGTLILTLVIQPA